MNFQTVINILISSSGYLLLALSFNMIYNLTKFFNLSHAILISGCTYLFYYFTNQFNNVYFSISLAILVTIIINLILYEFIYFKIKKNTDSSFILMITSLGVYTVFENLISITFGSEVKSLRRIFKTDYIQIFQNQITINQLSLIISSVIVFLIILFILNKTKFGIRMRAISSNEELANIYGIKAKRITYTAIIIGSIIASFAGLLISIDTDLRPSSGFDLFLFGVIAMIIGGIGTFWGLLGGALLLATAQQLGAYYIDSKWMNAIAYIILILFLVWKPLGFSGLRLKKIQI